MNIYMLTVLALEQNPSLFKSLEILRFKELAELATEDLYRASNKLSSSYEQRVEYSAHIDIINAFAALFTGHPKRSWHIEQYFIRTHVCKQKYIDFLNSFEDNELREYLLDFYKDLEDQ